MVNARLLPSDARTTAKTSYLIQVSGPHGSGLTKGTHKGNYCACLLKRPSRDGTRRCQGVGRNKKDRQQLLMLSVISLEIDRPVVWARSEYDRPVAQTTRGADGRQEGRERGY